MFRVFAAVVLAAVAGAVRACPDGCTCQADPATLSCSGWPLSRPLPLDNVTSLRLDAPTGSLPDGFFSSGGRLRSLHVSGAAGLRLSERSLTGLHALRLLSVTGSGLTALSPHTLALLPRLEELDLSGNRLAALRSHHFTYNTHLRRLSLAGNPLSAGAAPEAFAGADQLTELDLSRCSLRRAPGAWFRRLPALEALDLSGNRLSAVRAEDARHWTALRSLNLSNNALSHVEPAAFSAAARLAALDLSGNYLSRLVESGLTAEWLDLSRNSLTVANRSYVQLPAELRRLRLAGCQRLRHVGRNLLQQSRRLERLTVSGNPRLAEIEHTAFAGLERLRRVDLSDNALESLPRSLAPLRLDALDVSGNNLTCDCSLQWYCRRHPASPLTCRLGDSTVRLAEGLSHVLCEPVTVVVHQTQVWAPYNGSAELACRPAGTPPPAITWITPQRLVFHHRPSSSGETLLHPAQHTAQLAASHPTLDHYTVLADGRLRVTGAQSRHQGRYVCLAESDAGAAAASVYLTVGVSSLHDIKMMALLMALTGCLTAIAFALIVRLGLYIFYNCGCCICCTGELPPRKKLKGMVDSMEQWRALQLASLRDSYNQQVAGIKDSCYQQVERIRETYKGQARYLGDMRDYGAQQIEGFREQYLDQVRRVRDYSLCQMNRVHENYIFQRNRIRKFSSHQRVRLRETYKYQQRTLNKLLETLPDLYLQNCRTGACQRTESMMMPGEFCCDPDIAWPADELAERAERQQQEEEEELDQEEEPVGPAQAGAELTERLRLLAPALGEPEPAAVAAAAAAELARACPEPAGGGAGDGSSQGSAASEPASPLHVPVVRSAVVSPAQVEVVVLETEPSSAADPQPETETESVC